MIDSEKLSEVYKILNRVNLWKLEVLMNLAENHNLATIKREEVKEMGELIYHASETMDFIEQQFISTSQGFVHGFTISF